MKRSRLWLATAAFLAVAGSGLTACVTTGQDPVAASAPIVAPAYPASYGAPTYYGYYPGYSYPSYDYGPPAYYYPAPVFLSGSVFLSSHSGGHHGGHHH